MKKTLLVVIGLIFIIALFYANVAYAASILGGAILTIFEVHVIATIIIRWFV